MFQSEEIDYIKKFIEDRPKCKIYLGADSQRMRKKKVKFATAVIIHYIDDNGIGKGAKMFIDITYEEVQDSKLSRPFMRMMTEVNKLTELYYQLEDTLIDREFELHLDISTDEKNGSNVAYGYAKGMIWSAIGQEPIFKPDAFAASCCADRYSK